MPRGEQNYIGGIEDWKRDPDRLMELLRSGQLDPNVELDVDQPSPWALRYMSPTQQISDEMDRAAFRRAFGI